MLHVERLQVQVVAIMLKKFYEIRIYKCNFFYLGGISATVTTPLDVIKTRIMLANRNESASKLKILYVLQDVYRDKGLRG